MSQILGFIAGFVGIVVLWTFLRALSALVMTGKWPHQDPLSKDIFDNLP